MNCRPNAFIFSVINFTLVAKETVERRPKSNRVPVTVFIRDMNDNFPEFTKPVYEVSNIIHNFKPFKTNHTYLESKKLLVGFI